jgi:hypothetical protein
MESALFFATSRNNSRSRTNEIRFGDDAQFEAAVAGKLLQNSARDLIAPLGWLIGIGCGSQGDGFSRLHATQIMPQQFGGMLLDIDFLLELRSVPQFHKFMSVAGIAVLAGKLASAVRIDRPGERHADASTAV